MVDWFVALIGLLLLLGVLAWAFYRVLPLIPEPARTVVEVIACLVLALFLFKLFFGGGIGGFGLGGLRRGY